MDADGSKSGDDSVPLLFSETGFVHAGVLRVHSFDRFLDYLHRK